MITASLAFPDLAACKGLELLDQLTVLAREIKSKMQTMCAERSISHAPIEVHQGDILDFDWYDADIIYLSALCFPAELIAKIADLLPRAKRGTRVISLKQFPSRPSYLELFACIRVKMSWGVQPVFYYRVV